MAKLFTVTDLERCARLAATRASEGRTIEGSVTESVELVSNNVAKVYDEFTVLEIAQLAAKFGADEQAAQDGRAYDAPLDTAGCAVRAFKERTNGQ